MRAASASRGVRSVHRAGAVLVFALVVLVHVFGCAHGPTAAEHVRTDALALTAPAACEPPPGHPKAPSHGTESHCCTEDAPLLQSAPDHGTAVTTAAPADLPAAPALPHLSGTPPPPLSPGNDRARLGVWRT
ncbi:hypothetical protein IAG44_03445 [Streptomyces roseirectus]|uniref:Uncharacterized protein n=1 Tax=Streptomyces roseirectus TaxID=2768066 RepID=A0A7H0I753_9ACTN|nr:hypothetical protein [Streptomyces roseirectus]QNP68619.1 hypothetical protein IAG44_03445 [Streptomyces roseirectus]